MGYDTSKLSLLVQDLGGGRSLWSYFSADTMATILGSGYVSDATNKGVKLGDFVMVASGTLNAATFTNPTTAAYGDAATQSALAGAQLCVVGVLSAGLATLVGAEKQSITDNSGGTASATIAATLSTQVIPFYTTLASLANSQVIQVLPGFAGKITGANFHTRAAATTASKLATATAQINGTNITTGGVISLTSATATPSGTVIAGTAVTAQAFTAAQPIGFNISAVTAFVEGDGYLELQVVNSDLANAIASILAF